LAVIAAQRRVMSCALDVPSSPSRGWRGHVWTSPQRQRRRPLGNRVAGAAAEVSGLNLPGEPGVRDGGWASLLSLPSS